MAMQPKPVEFVSVVVPVYNEEGCLQELIDRSLKSLRETGKRFELVMIDDGSADASPGIMERAAEANPDQAIACFLNRNYGQHSAIMAGFSLVRGDLVITIDADLQNPPEEIPNLVKKAEEGYDVVGTVRQHRQDTFFRRYASKIVNRVAQKATGVNMHDYGCMLRAYRRHIVDAMKMCPENSTFIPVLGNSFARYTCEIPVAHFERVVGESKYSLLKLLNLQFNLLTCMTTVPLRMMTYFGILAALGGFIAGIALVILKIIMDWSETDQLLIFSGLFTLAGIQLIGMGLLGEYLGRVYDDVRARPKFFVERVVGRKQD